MNKVIISLLFSILINYVSFGQFTITNTLRTNNKEGLKIGDNAYLTASNGVDANGEGWMRLTEAKSNQKGYFYVQQSFPTTMGVIIDFEYVSWRNVYDGYFGADGFTIFLFNGIVNDTNFKLGGYGGSLGYATFSNPPLTKGLTGGYLGIGFDAYGNYSRAAENRNGGTTTFTPNAIVMRGPTTETYNESNIYLTKVDLGNRNGNADEIRKRNEIDYNEVVNKRPLPTLFYRRVQVSITKQSGNYLINIKWRKENQTSFTNLLTYTLSSASYPLPNTLKLGFAGGTGGGFNFQEIRNIILTTPGSLRVDSRSDNAYLCNSKKSTINFKVEITNDSDAVLTAINLNTKLRDVNNNLLDTNKFKITNVSLTSNFTNSTIPSQGYNTNEIKGVVGLPAKSSGIITITGEYIKGINTNSSFNIFTTIDTKQITDEDLTNNVSTQTIDIRKCNILSNPSLPAKYE